MVDLDRFAESLARTPGLRERLFTPGEAYPRAGVARRPVCRQGGAAPRPSGAPGDLDWHDAEVFSEDTGRPAPAMRGTVTARAEELGAVHVHLSLSHDAGIASAVVVLES